MTVTVKLIQRDDFTANISDLDLNGFADGIGLSSWTPGQIQEDTGRIFDDMNLAIKGTSVNDLATKQQALANMMRLVKQSKSAAEKYGVWLYTQLDGESKARQAYITNVKQGQITSPISHLVRRKFISESALTFERMPYWEDTAVTSIQGGGYLSSVGGMGLHDVSCVGDQPARMAMLYLTSSIEANGPLTKLWLGLRSTQYGNPANFQPYWSLRKSYFYSADTTGGTTHADASAVDGYKVICTFATSTALTLRLFCKPGYVTANVNDQRGTFKVLLRAKNSAAGTTRVRIGDGYANSTNMNYKPRVPISSTSWQFYDLGQVTLPSPGNLVNGVSQMAAYGITLDAERVSGTPNLEMDCFVMIPYDECSVYVPDGYVYSDGIPTVFNQTVVVIRPDNQHKAYITDVSVVSQNISIPYVNGMGIPLGTVYSVVAGQRASSSVLADVIYPNMTVYQRWDQLRGNE